MMMMLMMIVRTFDENKPLETRQLRERRQVTESPKYTKSVLRVNFPSDGLVLQATFAAEDTISTVIDFVSTFLAEPNVGFVLYTTPPKEILSARDTLAQKRLVPAAMVHFGQTVLGKAVLRPDVSARVTSFRAITEATKQLRRELHGLESTVLTDLTASRSSSSGLVGQASGGSGHSSVAPARPAADEFRASSVATSSNTGKVPKWFKLGK